MPPGQFLLHAAIERALRLVWGDLSTEPNIHLTMQYLHVMGSGRHIIRWLAESLRTHAAIPLSKLRERWDADLQRQITDRDWGAILESPAHIPRNARFKLIQYYITQRAYMTPEAINRIFNRADAQCPRCDQVGSDLLHMLWSCPALTLYWETVSTHLARCTDRTLAWTWEVCILGLYKRQKKHRATNRFIDLGLITAKRLITKRWKSTDPPPAQAWYQSMSCWAHAEGVSLRREDALGWRRFPVAAAWDAILVDFRHKWQDHSLSLPSSQAASET